MLRKKYLASGLKLALMAVLAGSLFLMGGCGTEGGNEVTSEEASGADTSSLAINVISREDGSGTRSAFVELFGVQGEAPDGKKYDDTTIDAVITNSTSVMLTTVEGDVAAIGYVSLGSMNNSVMALEIEGAAATPENVKSGTYPIQRDFNIATMGNASAAAEDFINFIMSKEGQAIVEDNNYIAAASNAADFSSNNASGKVVVGGSSSVSPVMEKLIEAYVELNSSVEIQLQTSDSSVGMSSTIDGIIDIGMASRELKDSELEKGLTPQRIAIDGLAVIVNNDNPVSGMSIDQVRDIFLGNTKNWSEIA
ncbi:MAG: substrate-binding domain-containing protein [Coriobacteriia bacterium]|nr:substrate-binding domain-containing protein [Coriobacteriia bacterium]